MIESASSTSSLNRPSASQASRVRRGDFAGRLRQASASSEVRTRRATTPRSVEPPPKQSANGFVRSQQATFAAHIPRFESVPPGAQWPQGPYRQAPDEYGGEWWLVSPFSGEEPWVAASGVDEIITARGEQPDPPADFVRLFGPRPERSDFSTRSEFKIGTFVWERELNTFEGVGLPEGFTEEQVELASEAFSGWGMGEPVFYKSRNGWAARFPDAKAADFQADVDAAIKAPHVVIANYQIYAVRHGVQVLQVHPLLPSGILTPAESTVNA